MERDEVAFPSKFRGGVLGAAGVWKMLQVGEQKSIHAHLVSFLGLPFLGPEMEIGNTWCKGYCIL